MISIDHDICEGSGVCAMVCPEDVIDFQANKPVLVKPQACTSCWICVENCASGAIELD